MRIFISLLVAGITITVTVLTYKKLSTTLDSVTKTSNDYDASLTEIKTKLGIS